MNKKNKAIQQEPIIFEPVAVLCVKCWRHKIVEVHPDEVTKRALITSHAYCECGARFGVNTPILRYPDLAETRVLVLEHERNWYKQLAEQWQKSDEKKDIELRAIKETLDRLGRSSMPFPYGMWPR